MGKKSAPEAEQSPHERALAETSLAKHERYKQIYAPVERHYVQETQRDMSNTLASRNMADVEQAKAGGWTSPEGRSLRTGHGFVAAGGDGQDMAARNTGIAAGNKAGLGLKDKAMNDALAIGQGKAADAQGGLAVAARSANAEAIARARARETENQALAEAVGTAAGAYTAYKLNGSAKPSQSGRAQAGRLKARQEAGRWGSKLQQHSYGF